jgi:ribonuclease Z
MQIIFLGTSGSVPTPKRNVPAIAVKMGKEVILFDCGEGTQRQFMDSPVSFMQVSKIVLSHLHGDHFLGFNGLAQTMSFNGRTEKLEVYGPAGTADLVGRFLSLGYFTPSFTIAVNELTDGNLVDFGAYSIRCRSSEHTVPSLAYALEEKPRRGKFDRETAEKLGIPPGPIYTRLQNGETVTCGGKKFTPDMVVGPPRRGRKIVYSGDTKPCDAVAELARDCDVLMHDATIESPLEEKTNQYGHSSARQAAEIAKSANARCLILVHISPRYDEPAGLLEEAKGIFQNTIIAEDLMVYDVKYAD